MKARLIRATSTRRAVRRRRISIALAVTALVATALAAPVAASGPTGQSNMLSSKPSASAPRVGHNGRWFVDSQGRVIIFHGGNVVAKGGTTAPSDFGFDEQDAAYAKSLGFNVVRLGIVWSAVEPSPGVYDENYLAKIAQTQQELWKHGIYTLLDSHQDFYSKRYSLCGPLDITAHQECIRNSGNGAPDWAVITPPDADNGGEAWQSFWDNALASDGIGLQDHFAAMWKHVATKFVNLPGVVGYDILNEPAPGADSGGGGTGLQSGIHQSCTTPVLGCPEFDINVLAAFYKKVIRAIRPVDQKTIINYEPNGTWALGVSPSWIPNLGDPNLAFSHHPYNSYTQSGVYGPATWTAPGVLAPSEDEYAQQVADRNNAPAWIGEIGAGSHLSDLGDADKSMQGYMYWTFWGTNGDGSSDPASTIRNAMQPPAGDNINQQTVTDYVRPYPRVIGGTPTGWNFDESSRAFSFNYNTIQPDGLRSTGETEVYLPSTDYAAGYTVALTGATVVSTSLGNQVLHIVANPGADTVALTVTPK